MANNGLRIDFAGIGARKSASTWVYACLDAHPKINCQGKNPGFFLDPPPLNEKEYARLFDPAQPGLNGDFSDAYLYDAAVAQRIHAFNPDMKIVVSFRNPIEVLRSAFVFVHSGLDHCGQPTEFREYVERGNWCGVPVREMVFFAKHLDVYRGLFTPKQIHVMFFEEIKNRPATVLGELYKFLGIDPDFRPKQTRRKVNPSGVVRSRAFADLCRLGVHTLKALHCGRLVENRLVMGTYNRLNKRRAGLLDDATRQWLWDLVRDDVRELEGMTGRDLGSWAPRC